MKHDYCIIFTVNDKPKRVLLFSMCYRVSIAQAIISSLLKTAAKQCSGNISLVHFGHSAIYLPLATNGKSPRIVSPQSEDIIPKSASGGKSNGKSNLNTSD
jgi:hypothetical protein